MNEKHRFNFALLSLTVIFSTQVFAGDPVPGIGITVEQAPDGIVGSGTTNNAGEFTVANLPAGDYHITLTNNGHTVVLGKTRADQISIAGGRSAAVKPIRLELSSYQDGSDLALRKRPGGTRVLEEQSDSDVATSTTSRATDYNSSRSNRTTASAAILDDDSDNDTVEDISSVAAPAPARTTAAPRTTREVAAAAVDNDCSGIAEIIPGPDSLTIRLSCDN